MKFTNENSAPPSPFVGRRASHDDIVKSDSNEKSAPPPHTPFVVIAGKNVWV